MIDDRAASGVVSELSEESTAREVERALRRGDPIELRVFGGSMMPTIWPGARLAVEACALGDTAVGDVVVVRGPRGLLVHRIVDKADDGAFVRGDAQRTRLRIDESNLLGRVAGLTLARSSVNGMPRAIEARLRRAYLPIVPWAARCYFLVRAAARLLERTVTSRASREGLLTPSELSSLPARLRRSGWSPTASRLRFIRAAVIGQDSFVVWRARGDRLEALMASYLDEGARRTRLIVPDRPSASLVAAMTESCARYAHECGHESE